MFDKRIEKKARNRKKADGYFEDGVLHCPHCDSKLDKLESYKQHSYKKGDVYMERKLICYECENYVMVYVDPGSLSTVKTTTKEDAKCQLKQQFEKEQERKKKYRERQRKSKQQSLI